MYQINDKQMNEYTLLKARNSQLEACIFEDIVDRLEYLNTLVVEKKYDKVVWFNQFNIDVNNSDRRNRIIKLAKNLNLNYLNLTNSEKEEIGFYLYCDYLKGIHKKIEKRNGLIDCETTYVCHLRTGEILHLFGNPLTKKHLIAAYENNLKLLKEKRNALPSTDSDGIAKCDNAVRMLKALKNKLIEDWETKVNPLDPSIDDRKIKDMPLGNSLLKSLAKEEESTTQSLLNPAE